MKTCLQQAIEQLTRLERQNSALRELNGHKDKFLALVSHDLRSPFSGIFMAAELIRKIAEEQENDALLPIVTQLQRSVEHYNALLENLLTWARLEQGLLEFTPQKIDLSLLIVRNVALFASNAGEKQITVHHVEPSRLMVWADLRMVDAIIRNLLSNALKFTRPGGNVDIEISTDDGTASLTVHDTGIGIPADKLPDLFAIHARYKRPGTVGESSTGLGLILCAEFVKYHGGVIRIESKEGAGTTVCCSFPLAGRRSGHQMIGAAVQDRS